MSQNEASALRAPHTKIEDETEAKAVEVDERMEEDEEKSQGR